MDKEIGFNQPKNGVVELSRPGLNNLGLCVLAVVAAISIGSGAALADVEVSVDQGTCTQAFEMLPVGHQPHIHTPACSITCQIDVDRTSLPPINFSDLLSTTDLGQSANTNYYYPPADTQAPPSRTVHQLPAGPGGATLFLMGVGCLGAVKLGRSARSLHLQSLPNWYHTGGPIQIGGAAALDFDYDTPVFSALDEPSGLQKFTHHTRRDLPPRCEDQFLLTVEAPRGPPRLYS